MNKVFWVSMVFGTTARLCSEMIQDSSLLVILFQYVLVAASVYYTLDAFRLLDKRR